MFPGNTLAVLSARFCLINHLYRNWLGNLSKYVKCDIMNVGHDVICYYLFRDASDVHTQDFINNII